MAEHDLQGVPQSIEEMAHFCEEGQRWKLCWLLVVWHMWCVCLPAVAKVLLSAPAPNSADIASLVPSTLEIFFLMFLHWEEKGATIQIILLSLSSHMTRNISFPFMPIKIAIFK